MAQFSKRDYIWLASVARDMLDAVQFDDDYIKGVETAIEVLADALAGENPDGFDHALFLTNAGL